MNFIYIIDALRTPVGSPFKGLKNFTASQLAAVVIKEIVKRNDLDRSLINEVILGNTVSAGIGQSLARQASIQAGLPVSIPAYAVNHVCGASLQSLIIACQAIRSGNAALILAGGTESATQCPLLFPNVDENLEISKAKGRQFMESLINDGLFCQLTGKRMGELAEDVAQRFKISRKAQDQFSLESHQKAVAAQKQGKFSKEIVPVNISSQQVLNKDERPRKNLTLKSFELLAPAFVKSGTVTSGNSSNPSDAACILMVASEKFSHKNKLKPLARIAGHVSVAVEPKDVFISAVPALKECLKKCRWSLEDVDLFEISEAFAAPVLYAQKILKIPPEKVNIWGGDIAIGHPLGAAGARILTTLCHALADQKKKRGLACISYGGGGCLATAVERT
ncbi:MAG: hypothetical protein A2Z88_03540 [Omnitrophica WOR_2 bacterium GWA2_47_8]|nr:MAG: hypothetical protein A2Z88_03540 [Omnitrophica WOR_2 bacterium GWA2_47_8]